MAALTGLSKQAGLIMAQVQQSGKVLPFRSRGFTRMPNTIIRAISKGYLKGLEAQIASAIVDITIGRNQDDSAVTIRDLAEYTELDRSVVSRTLKQLRLRDIVVESVTGKGKIFRLADVLPELGKRADSARPCNICTPSDEDKENNNLVTVQDLHTRAESARTDRARSAHPLINNTKKENTPL
ncbi:hypothetical protein CAI21_21635 [Alkalilimnicola ehrlichii]|nr:hypothetical protein CAI21_21635 [Alkalilimnicola ehrlichii]